MFKVLSSNKWDKHTVERPLEYNACISPIAFTTIYTRPVNYALHLAAHMTLTYKMCIQNNDTTTTKCAYKTMIRLPHTPETAHITSHLEIRTPHTHTSLSFKAYNPQTKDTYCILQL